MHNCNWANDISPGTSIPKVVNAIVEIPRGSRNKFELDKESGLMRLDRYLYSAGHFPLHDEAAC